MDPLLISAASGMKARMESLDMLANNMANSGTTAFKADREFYSMFRDELPKSPVAGTVKAAALKNSVSVGLSS